MGTLVGRFEGECSRDMLATGSYQGRTGLGFPPKSASAQSRRPPMSGDRAEHRRESTG